MPLELFVRLTVLRGRVFVLKMGDVTRPFLSIKTHAQKFLRRSRIRYIRLDPQSLVSF